jgi:4-hydroxy-tetrahydrodipicolinate synthase
LTGAPSTLVISLTPFDDQDRLDLDAFREHLRRLRAARIGVYVGGGGSGEGYTLSPDETVAVLTAAAEELNGHVPVRAMGVEPRSAKEMLQLARVVADSGLDSMQVYSLDAGHGRMPRPDELEAYFCDILDELPVKAVLSTHQSVGYWLQIDSLKRLVDRYDNIIGINVTNSDITYLIRVIDAVGDRIEIHVGGAMQGLTALALGANGFLTSEGNLAPRLTQSVIDRWVAGDLPGAADAFARVLRLYAAMAAVGGVSGTKAALNQLGLPGGVPRRPRLAVPPEWEARIAQILIDHDVRGVEGMAPQ